jgi:hypothetical protein
MSSENQAGRFDIDTTEDMPMCLARAGEGQKAPITPYFAGVSAICTILGL